MIFSRPGATGRPQPPKSQQQQHISRQHLCRLCVCLAAGARPGEPACRVGPHATGDGPPTGSQQAVSGLGPRPSSWDPSLGSFLPEIQSRASHWDPLANCSATLFVKRASMTDADADRQPDALAGTREGSRCWGQGSMASPCAALPLRAVLPCGGVIDECAGLVAARRHPLPQLKHPLELAHPSLFLG